MKFKYVFFSLLIAFLWSASPVMASNYVGAKKCKGCHGKKTGNQYKKWQASKHSKAMEALSSANAAKYAKAAGVADPKTDKACVICHSLKYDHEGNDTGLSSNGVECESCHGPGKKYKSKKVMKDQAKAIAAGLVIPSESTCKQCHVASITVGGKTYKNPGFKAFNFAERSKQIAHPRP